MADFLPRREGDLLAWSKAFAETIAVEFEALGLSEQQARSYGELHAAFAEAYWKAQGYETGTAAAVSVKNQLRDRLKDEARTLAAIVRANPAVDAEQRAMLGLGRPREGARTIPVPEDAPALQIVEVRAQTVSLRLEDAEVRTRGAKPRGAAGALLFRWVGEGPPPEDRASWSLAGTATERACEVTFPAELPMGTRVWVSACWVNPRLQTGPMAEPRTTRLHGVFGDAGAWRVAA